MAAGSSKVTVSHAQEENERKRGRDEEMADGEAPEKRQKEGDEDDMDMEVEESGPRSVTSNQPSSTLRCDNLPTEVTDDVLAVLFQQYPGFQSTHVSPVLGVNKSKTAHVRYDLVDQATTAKEALDGFALKKGWEMKVFYA